MNLYFHTSLSSIYITYQVEVSRDLKIFKKNFLKKFFYLSKMHKKRAASTATLSPSIIF